MIWAEEKFEIVSTDDGWLEIYKSGKIKVVECNKCWYCGKKITTQRFCNVSHMNKYYYGNKKN